MLYLPDYCVGFRTEPRQDLLLSSGGSPATDRIYYINISLGVSHAQKKRRRRRRKIPMSMVKSFLLRSVQPWLVSLGHRDVEE